MVRVMPLTPGPPGHPEGDADDDDGRRQLEVRLRGLAAPLAPEVLAGKGDDPDNRRVRERRRQSQQHRLRDRALDRDDEGGHHRLGVAGLQAVQGPSRIALGTNSQACATP